MEKKISYEDFLNLKNNLKKTETLLLNVLGRIDIILEYYKNNNDEKIDLEYEDALKMVGG